MEGKARQSLDVTTRDDRERKAEVYERMIERIIKRALEERGEQISRADVIEQVAHYQPEIKEYIH